MHVSVTNNTYRLYNCLQFDDCIKPDGESKEINYVNNLNSGFSVFNIFLVVHEVSVNLINPAPKFGTNTKGRINHIKVLKISSLLYSIISHFIFYNIYRTVSNIIDNQSAETNEPF